MVQAKIAMGNFSDALEAGKRAVESLPGCYAAHLMLGIVIAHSFEGIVEVNCQIKSPFPQLSGI